MTPYPPNDREWRIFVSVFGALTVLLALLIWAIPFFPTQDGPSHLYNAWLLHAVGDPRFPLISRHYAIQSSPFPNWATHAFLSVCLYAFPPRICEKIWLTVLVLGLPIGALMLADAGARASGSTGRCRSVPWWTLFSFPLALNHLMLKGFENHEFGLILFLIAVALAFRLSERWSGSRLTGLIIVVLLSYFSHLLSFYLILLALAIVLVLCRDMRHRIWSGLIFAGIGGLAYCFTREMGGHYQYRLPRFKELAARLGELISFNSLWGFDPDPAWAWVFPACVGIGIAIGISHWRRTRSPAGTTNSDQTRHRLCLAVILGAMAILYFLSPAKISHLSYILTRIQLYLIALVLCLLPLPRARIGKQALVVALVAASLYRFGTAVRSHQEISGHYRRLLAAAAAIPEHSIVHVDAASLPRWNMGISPLLHAICYGLLGKDCLYMNNYEATLAYFPIKRTLADEPEIRSIREIRYTDDDYRLSIAERPAPPGSGGGERVRP
jgi:hypothetical protein